MVQLHWPVHIHHNMSTGDLPKNSEVMICPRDQMSMASVVGRPKTTPVVGRPKTTSRTLRGEEKFTHGTIMSPQYCMRWRTPWHSPYVTFTEKYIYKVNPLPTEGLTSGSITPFVELTCIARPVQFCQVCKILPGLYDFCFLFPGGIHLRAILGIRPFWGHAQDI